MPRVVHFEIMAKDPEKTGAFYSEIFGWEVTKWDGPMDYWTVATGEGPGIGGGIARADDKFAGIMNVVDVDSVDDYVAKIEAAGGTIAVPKMNVPGVGDLAYGVDPGGNMFGIIQYEKAEA